MARRRALSGHAVLTVATGLIATTGATLVFGCGGKRDDEPVGNLMAMPVTLHEQVCVEVSPASAAAVITVDDRDVVDGCITVDGPAGQPIHVAVSAEGFEPATASAVLGEKVPPVKVVLTPAHAPPPPEPVGNLMAPQPPPPAQP